MINFCFGIHNHQPVGNFDHVFEDAYRKCYFPFIELLESFPRIKVTLHNTGILWDWIAEHHPEYFEYIDRLLEAGQLELLSGSYYEPILPAIADSHKIGQIRKLSDFLVQRFGAKVRGMWLAERVWEPHLTKTIAECGLEFTILDDTHFRWAGLTEDQLNGFFITEEQHHRLKLFPISKELRYAIPFLEVPKVFDILKRLAESAPGQLAVYADDGEKFGGWPDTYKLCYEEKWLAEFFDQVSRSADWLKMRFFSETIDTLEPNGRVYLPTASYAEMGQWSLPPAGFRHYEELEKHLKNSGLWENYGYLVRGGFWRNFLSKYPESNNMHKKMYRVAGKIEQVAAKTADIDQQKLAQATDLLYQGQCNCPYWHGVFGGLYLNHLRYATYNRFIRAERIADELAGPVKNGRIDVIDFDDDGHDEVIMETDWLNAYIAPRRGGSLFELDLKNKGLNLLDTMTRREEGYHKKLTEQNNPGNSEGKSIHDRVEVKEQGLEKYLIYDWHRRVSLVDHIMSSQTAFDEFAGNKYAEQGDFILEPFAYKTGKSRTKISLILNRNGHIYRSEGTVGLKLTKQIDLLIFQPALDIHYTLANPSEVELEFLLGVEFNWAMLAGDAPDRYYRLDDEGIEKPRLNSKGESPEIDNFGIIDEYHKLDINITLSQPCRLWRFPIETVSLSEYGFERVYQSSVTCPCFPISLAPGESKALKFEIRLSDL